MSSPDEFVMKFPKRMGLEIAVRGDRRTQLEAVRDYIAHQLEGQLCKTCEMSRLRTGDQASLILRLQKTLEELEGLPEKGMESDLDNLRRLTVARSPDRTSASTDISLSGKGTQRRRRSG